MNFLLPLGLLGLLTLPIILILHLLRNRRELLTIPSLRLWQGLQQQKQGALPRNIPLSLLLLLQLAAAIALSLALARPALSFLLLRPQHAIFILDTTTSMTAADGAGSRFDAARQVILDHLELMGDGDTAAIVTLNNRPEILAADEGRNKAALLSAVNGLTPGGTGLDLAAALTLANSLVNPNRETEIVVLTDGAYNLDDQPLPVMLAPLTWSGLAGPAGNQALLNVSVRTLPDQRHRLFARIVNYSDSPVERTVRVVADNALFDERVVRLDGGQETARVWTLPAPAETAVVEIAETDALLLDNRAEVLLHNAARLSVLLVSDTPETLQRALAAQPGVDVTVETPAFLAGETLDLSERLADFDLTVLDGLPVEVTGWPRGNLWVVNPPLGHTLLPAQNFVRNLRPDPATASGLLAGVDLSGVYISRAPDVTLPDWAESDLLGVPADGSGASYSLIFHGTAGASRLVVWAFNLAESNLPARLALPLMTANTLSSLVMPALPQVVPLGEPLAIHGNFSVETPAGRRLFLSSAGSEAQYTFAQTREPGLYRVYNDHNVQVAGFAVQAGSALESNLAASFQPEQAAITYAADPAAAGPRTANQEFWSWLVGLALLAVTVEGWLAWRR